MSRRTSALVLVSILAACGGSGKPAPQTPLSDTERQRVASFLDFLDET
jgi:hypothetical protein